MFLVICIALLFLGGSKRVGALSALRSGVYTSLSELGETHPIFSPSLLSAAKRIPQHTTSVTTPGFLFTRFRFF